MAKVVIMVILAILDKLAILAKLANQCRMPVNTRVCSLAMIARLAKIQLSQLFADLANLMQGRTASGRTQSRSG